MRTVGVWDKCKLCVGSDGGGYYHMPCRYQYFTSRCCTSQTGACYHMQCRGPR